MDNTADSSMTAISKTPPETTTLETEIQIPNFPIIKQEDNSILLPSYFAIINRTGKNGVRMEDLDQLQQDFEKLLSTCAVRHGMLRAEVNEESRQKEKWTRVKWKRPDYKLQARKHRVMILKEKHYPLLKRKAEAPKKSRSVTTYKFWKMVDGYCSNVTKDDRAFLDNLIKECRKNADMTIPELGEYYGLETKIVSRKLMKNSYNAKLNNISSAQRFLSASTQKEVNMTTLSKVTGKMKAPDLSGYKMSANICLELVEENFLKPEDVRSSSTPEDEILREIKKCQKELYAVNEQNIQELIKLKDITLKYQSSL